MDKKEQTRLRVQRYRDKQKGVTDVTLDVTDLPQSVTLSERCVTSKPSGVTQGVTSKPSEPDIVNPHNFTGQLYWYDQGKRIELKEIPLGCAAFSDGQCWRPDKGGWHG